MALKKKKKKVPYSSDIVRAEKSIASHCLIEIISNIIISTGNQYKTINEIFCMFFLLSL